MAKTTETLTEQERAFAELIDQDIPQKEAYIKAFGNDITEQYTINTIYVKSSNLAHSAKVQDYLRQKHKREEQQFINDISKHRIEMISLIKERMEVCQKSRDENNLTKYVNMLNRIYGLYNDTIDAETEKHDDIKQLSLEELKKIAGSAI